MRGAQGAVEPKAGNKGAGEKLENRGSNAANEPANQFKAGR